MLLIWALVRIWCIWWRRASFTKFEWVVCSFAKFLLQSLASTSCLWVMSWGTDNQAGYKAHVLRPLLPFFLITHLPSFVNACFFLQTAKNRFCLQRHQQHRIELDSHLAVNPIHNHNYHHLPPTCNHYGCTESTRYEVEIEQCRWFSSPDRWDNQTRDPCKLSWSPECKAAGWRVERQRSWDSSGW